MAKKFGWWIREPLEGHVLPRHMPKLERRGHTLFVKLPKDWKEGIHSVTTPTGTKWSKKGVIHVYTKGPGRRERLENVGTILGVGGTAIALGVTPAKGMPTLAYMGAAVGYKLGDKVDDYLTKHEKDYKKAKKFLEKEVKRGERAVRKRVNVRVVYA